MRRFFLAVTLCTTTPIGAQSAPLPAIRELGAITGRSTTPIGAPGPIVELSDHRVVVNDMRSRRLLILDSSLAHPVVALDSAGPPDRLYPAARGGTLLRYIGDTVLFTDPAARGFLVIAPTGVVGRVLSFPPGAAPLAGTANPFGVKGDREGHIVYWARATVPCGDHTTLDSNIVYRVNPTTRAVDTVGYARNNKLECPVTEAAGPMVAFDDASAAVADAPAAPRLTPALLNALGGRAGTTTPTILSRDDWTVLDDGTVAIVRAETYTVDWIDPDGKRRSTPKVATLWKKVTDEEKLAVMDTVRRVNTERADSVYAAALKDPRVIELPEDVRRKLTPEMFLPRFLNPTDLPDYWHNWQAPIRADLEGHLWIPEAVHQFVPLAPGEVPAPVVYDIVNRQGVLIDRVRVPKGTLLVGFGAGVAYLTSADAGGVILLRARLR